MNPRILKASGIAGLVLALQGEASLPADGTDGSGARVVADVMRILPPTVLTVEAEDRDVETVLSITILTDVPDLRRAAGAAWRVLLRR